MIRYKARKSFSCSAANSSSKVSGMETASPAAPSACSEGGPIRSMDARDPAFVEAGAPILDRPCAGGKGSGRGRQAAKLNGICRSIPYRVLTAAASMPWLRG